MYGRPGDSLLTTGDNPGIGLIHNNTMGCSIGGLPVNKAAVLGTKSKLENNQCNYESSTQHTTPYNRKAKTPAKCEKAIQIEKKLTT